MKSFSFLVLLSSFLLVGNAFASVYECKPIPDSFKQGNGLPKDFLNLKLDTNTRELVVKAEAMDTYGSCGKQNIGKFTWKNLRSSGGGVSGSNYVYHKEYLNMQQMQEEDIAIYLVNENNDKTPYMYIDYISTCVEGNFQVILTCKKTR